MGEVARQKSAVAHKDAPIVVEAVIESPGIETAIEPPHGDLSAELLAQFEFRRDEGIGRYRQEDAGDVLSLAYWDLRRLAAVLADDAEDVKVCDIRILKLEEHLNAGPKQRFSMASRQRDSRHYRHEGAARSPEHAAWQAMMGNGSDSS